MKTPCAAILFALLLLAGCGKYDPAHKNYADDDLQWGQPVDGLQVGLARRQYEPGTAPGRDQVYFAVQMRNVSGRPLSILAPTAITGSFPEKRVGDESVNVTLTYDSAAGLKTAQFKPTGKPVVQVMEPGKGYNLELRLAPSKFGLERFVSGRMSAAYANAQQAITYEAQGGQTVTGLWTGQAASGAVVMDATPAATRESKQPKARAPGGAIDAAAVFQTIDDQPAVGPAAVASQR